jgi:hypothetical protein
MYTAEIDVSAVTFGTGAGIRTSIADRYPFFLAVSVERGVRSVRG